MSFDPEIVETGSGGDMLPKGNDLSVIFGFENMPYLALFGGNVAQSTPVTRVPAQQAADWWGNALFMPADPGMQFNSETERMLHSVPLTSAGRLRIEGAIKKDLEFMSAWATIMVSTQIIATDRLRIAIGIKRPDNLQQREFIYIWDATKGDLLATADYTPAPSPPQAEALEYELEFYL